jgi:hypothetical protein
VSRLITPIGIYKLILTFCYFHFQILLILVTLFPLSSNSMMFWFFSNTRWQFLYYFIYHCLSFCPFSFAHCVVCLSLAYYSNFSFDIFFSSDPNPPPNCLLFICTICFQSRQHSLQYTLDKSTGQWRNDNPRHWQHCVHKTKNMISCEFTVVILINVHVEESYNRMIKTANQSNRVFKKQNSTKAEKNLVMISWPDYAIRQLRNILFLPLWQDNETWNPNKGVGLVQNIHHYYIIECNLFSQWYGIKQTNY